MIRETGFDPRLLERFPDPSPRPEGEAEELERMWARPPGWTGWFRVVNNNYIGPYYIGAALLFFILAGILALVMRAQLAAPMAEILPPETYNQFFTMHGTMMMFLFAVPAGEAIAVLLLPQILGARDLPFPRLSAYAFWAYLAGGLFFFSSLFFGLAPDGGWFMYPPLASKAFSPGLNAAFWLLGIGFIEISAIAGAIEILVGVMKTRPPGMTLGRMPIIAWALLVFAVMILIAFPAIILGTLLLELERAVNWPFFDPTRGGDPMLWEHLFWFFGHPEVYIIFLPAAGMMSMIIPTVVRAPLVGYRLVVLAILATGFISFGVWAHHMFTTGMPPLSVSFFSAASMAVSVPAGVQVFAWIATAGSGKFRFNTPGLFTLGSLIIFTMGGLTGVMVGLAPFDWQAHDTYFIVAHLHYVLIGGMVFPLFAGLYYWIPLVSRRALSERLGKWVFWLIFAGMHVAFLPMHLTGLMGMPRRVYTYLPGRGWELLNLISTVGAFILAAGVALFLWDLARNFRLSISNSRGDVYGGGTLEWLPSGRFGLRSIPVVKSRYPLWDDPDLGRDVAAGRYLMAANSTGRRETLVTSPLNAEPHYVQTLPGPTAWPLGAALFTAGFFALLTVQAYGLSLVSAALAVLAVLRWLWDIDIRPKVETAQIGAGLTAPTYVTGPGGHGWWAMFSVLVVVGMIGSLALFSYVFLWSRNPDLWIAPAGGLAPLLLLCGAAGALALAAPRLIRRTDAWAGAAATAAIATSILALLTAAGLDMGAWRSVGLAPVASSQGATVFALISFQLALGGFGLVMACFCVARLVAKRFDHRTPSTADLVCIFLGYLAVQGAGFALVPRLFPGAF